MKDPWGMLVYRVNGQGEGVRVGAPLAQTWAVEVRDPLQMVVGVPPEAFHTGYFM